MSPDHLLSLVSFFIALSFTALFSFLETTITALRLFKLKEVAQQQNARYKNILSVLEHSPHRVLIMILIASSSANTIAAATITNLMEDIFTQLDWSRGLGFSAGVAIATGSILVFGEIIPKNFAKMYGERFFPSILWLINLMYKILNPIAVLLGTFSQGIIRLIWGKGAEEGVETLTSEREVKFLIDYIDEKGLMESEKTEMLQSIFALSQTPVKEIMVPSTNIVSINVDALLSDALNLFKTKHFSRVPVWEGRPENIIGMVYQKDIFSVLLSTEPGSAPPLKQFLRPIMFVPENSKVNQLLREFKQQRMHIAMVVNEFGGISGLVTLEDVIEEIVGEIADEHENVTDAIIPLKQGGWLVDASVSLEELSEVLGITFETETSITLGGFLTEQLQHLPRKGERISYKNYCFQIQHATPKRVHEVLIFQESGNQSPVVD